MDLRIRRTLTNIRNAFLELVVEIGFDNLSVQALCERAVINRATFYRHYRDKYDLAERLLDVLFQFKPTPETDPLAQAVELFEHVGQYAAFYRAAVGRGGIPQFRERIQAEIEAGLTEGLNINSAREGDYIVPSVLTIRYMAAAQAGFVQWWLENDQPFPAEEAARYLLYLHAEGGSRALRPMPASGGDG